MSHRRAICKGCEQERRDSAKASLQGRARMKAWNCLRSHAEHLGKSVAELRDTYGWIVDNMTHDILHAFENGCPYCRQPFHEMEHGLANMSLDIVRPGDAPYYGINTQWVCRTCNTEKQRTPPNEWGENLQGRRMWQEWQRKRMKQMELWG